MIIPVMVGAAAVAAWWNRRRIGMQVQRDYLARFPQHNGVARGGEALSLTGSNGFGVLLIHGSGDSPQTLSFLAEQLNDFGYTVSVPRLPGHAESPYAFAEATSDSYVHEARTALNALEQQCSAVAVVGLSMGGAVATQLVAADHAVKALVLLAPYFVPGGDVRVVNATSAAWGMFTPYLAGRGEASVLDPAASAESRAYGTFSPGALRALVATAARGLAAIPHLAVPVLVVHSDRDNRISRKSAEQALRAFRVPPEVHWVSGCGHVITVDYCKEEVAALTRAFLADHLT